MKISLLISCLMTISTLTSYVYCQEIKINDTLSAYTLESNIIGIQNNQKQYSVKYNFNFPFPFTNREDYNFHLSLIKGEPSSFDLIINNQKFKCIVGEVNSRTNDFFISKLPSNPIDFKLFQLTKRTKNGLDSCFVFYNYSLFASGLLNNGFLMDGGNLEVQNQLEGLQGVVMLKKDEIIYKKYEFAENQLRIINDVENKSILHLKPSGDTLAWGYIDNNNLHQGQFIETLGRYKISNYRDGVLHGKQLQYFWKDGHLDFGSYLETSYQNGLKHGKTYGIYQEVQIADGLYKDGEPFDGMVCVEDPGFLEYNLMKFNLGKVIEGRKVNLLFKPIEIKEVKTPSSDESKTSPITDTLINGIFYKNGTPFSGPIVADYRTSKVYSIMYVKGKIQTVSTPHFYGIFVDTTNNFIGEYGIPVFYSNEFTFDFSSKSGYVNYFSADKKIAEISFKDGQFIEGSLILEPTFQNKSKLLRFYIKCHFKDKQMTHFDFVYPNLDIATTFRFNREDQKPENNIFIPFVYQIFDLRISEIHTIISGESLYDLKSGSLTKYFLHVNDEGISLTNLGDDSTRTVRNVKSKDLKHVLKNLK